jgi:MYXO-CTERM domain-containing protein
MFTSGTAHRCITRSFVLLLGLIVCLPLASADVTDTVLTITACTGRAEGSIAFTQSDGYWDGDDFFLRIDEPRQIVCPGGEGEPDVVLGTFGPAEIAFYADPQVNLGFSAQAGDDPTAFTITSALLSFPTMLDGRARADAAFTLQDFFGFGAQLTGNGPGGGAYLTQYNGYVPGGTTFGEGISSLQVVPPDILSVAEYHSSPSGEFYPIGSVSDMSSRIAFTLSPYALASGSANFEIIPEPAAFLLLVAGLLAARRR